MAAEDFADARHSRGVGVLGQLVGGKESLLGDLPVWLGDHREAPGAHDKERDVVVRKMAGIGIKGEQFWLAFDNDTDLFVKFSPEGHHHVFTLLHTAAGELPARSICVTDKEHPVVRIDNKPLRAKCQPARYAPVALQGACDQLFGVLFQAILSVPFRAGLPLVF